MSLSAAPLRPLLLPALLTVLALTAYNTRVSREMGDFEVYRTAGRRVLAAEPLYREAEGDRAFTSLPAFAMAMAPAAILGDDGARVGWYALSCACLVLLLRWSVLALPARRWTERSLVMVAVLFLARFYVHDLALGQSTLLLSVVLLAGLGALQLDAPKLAAVAFTLAVFITPYTLILIPWLAASYGAAVTAISVAGLATGLLLPAVFYGWAGNLAQLWDWWHLAGIGAGIGNVSLSSMWVRGMGPGTLANGLTAVSVILLVAVAATMWRQRARVTEPDYTEFAFLLLIIPLISPHGWDYMLLLATPAVVCVTDRWRELRTPWRMVSGIALTLMGINALFPALSVVTLGAAALAATLAQIRVRALA